MRRALLLSVTLAACAASGSDDATHGPVFVEEDAGGDGASDATIADAATTSDVATNDDGAIGDEAGDDDATGDDGGAIDAPIADVASDAPACTSTTALLAGSTTAAFGASAVGEASLAAQSVSGSFASAPAVGVLAGAFEALARENGNALASSGLGASWSGLAALPGNPASLDAPAIAPVGSALHAVYLGTDNRYYHATFNGTAWDSGGDRVGVVNDAGAQAFGPARASAASVGSELVIRVPGERQPRARAVVDERERLDERRADRQRHRRGERAGGARRARRRRARPPRRLREGERHEALRRRARWNLEEVGRAGRRERERLHARRAFARGDERRARDARVARHGRLRVHERVRRRRRHVVDAGAARRDLEPAVPSAPSLAPGVCGDDAIAAYVSSGGVGVARYRGGTWLAPSSVGDVSGASVVTIATAP